MIVEIKDLQKSTFKVAGNPIKINRFKDFETRKKPPKLDENRTKILREFKI